VEKILEKGPGLSARRNGDIEPYEEEQWDEAGADTKNPRQTGMLRVRNKRKAGGLAKGGAATLRPDRQRRQMGGPAMTPGAGTALDPRIALAQRAAGAGMAGIPSGVPGGGMPMSRPAAGMVPPAQPMMRPGVAGGFKKGGRLTAAERQSLPKSEFALPGKGKGPKGAGAGSYPIPDESHARNALSRVSQHGSPSEKATVRREVHQKFPDIGQS